MKKNKTNSRRRSKFQNKSFNNLNLAAIALLALSLMFTAACGNDSADRAERVGGVTARQIIENPSAYVGKVVTVSGDVEEIFGPRAFEMDSGLSVGELLVIGREPYPAIPEAGNRAYVVGDVATVTGLVTMLVTAEVEREVGWDLTPEIEAEYSNKPVLIAQNVLFKPGARSANAAIPPTDATDTNTNSNTMNTAANNAGATNGGDITDVAVIINAPDREKLVGKRVNIQGVQVQSVVGDRMFYVGPGNDKGLLVALVEEKTPNTQMEGKVDVNKGQTIALSGTIHRVPNMEEARKQFDGLLSDKELQTITDQKVYLRTNKVNISQRP